MKVKIQQTTVDIFLNQTFSVLADYFFWFAETKMAIQNNRKPAKTYYLPKGIIKYYNVIISQQTFYPANISTTQQRCFKVVDQRYFAVENETECDVRFSTLDNVDTISELNVEATLYQRFL